MNAPKPRLTGASGDSLGSGVSDRVQATRSSVQMLATGHWVVGRSGRYRLLVAYDCPCGEKHVALSRGRSRELERRTPCGLDVQIVVTAKDAG